MTTRDRVLKMIAKWPGVHIGDLSRLLGKDRSNLCRMVRDMAEDGLIEIKEEPVREGSKKIMKRMYRKP